MLLSLEEILKNKFGAELRNIFCRKMLYTLNYAGPSSEQILLFPANSGASLWEVKASFEDALYVSPQLPGAKDLLTLTA